MTCQICAKANCIGECEPKIKPAQQEPVAWVNQANLNSAAIQRNRGGQGDTHTWSETPTWDHSVPLYTSPSAQRKPLTLPQINQMMTDAGWQNSAIRQADLDKVEKVARAIEAKLKEKNT